jgi:hypothetical protein
MHMCVICQSVFCYKFSLWDGKRAMCAMLRCSHFVEKSIQGVQTWSNSNNMHVVVRHKTEQRFIAFLISYASCTFVWYVNQCKCHVRDVALLPFRQQIDSRRTNLIESQQHACWCAPLDRTAFHCVFDKLRIMHMCAVCQSVQVPCARCCATPISSRNLFKPYKLDRIATACMLMFAIRQNSVSLRFW